MRPVPESFPVFVASHFLEGDEFGHLVSAGSARVVGLQAFHARQGMAFSSVERVAPDSLVHSLVALLYGGRRCAYGAAGLPCAWRDVKRAVKVWDDLRRVFRIRGHAIQLSERW